MQHFIRRKHLYLTIVGTLVVAAILITTWRPEYVFEGKSSRSFTVATQYLRLRQMMVRKNATSAIVGHSGMKLLSESISGITIDTSRDERPILNAILGRSQSDVTAQKRLSIQLQDP